MRTLRPGPARARAQAARSPEANAASAAAHAAGPVPGRADVPCADGVPEVGGHELVVDVELEHVHPSCAADPSIYIYIYLYISISIYISIDLSIYLSIYIYIYLYIRTRASVLRGRSASDRTHAPLRCNRRDSVAARCNGRRAARIPPRRVCASAMRRAVGCARAITQTSCTARDGGGRRRSNNHSARAPPVRSPLDNSAEAAAAGLMIERTPLAVAKNRLEAVIAANSRARAQPLPRREPWAAGAPPASATAQTRTHLGGTAEGVRAVRGGYPRRSSAASMPRAAA
jgi:hypothetical protein